MTGRRIVRRYAPLGVVLAVQLVMIALLPSTASRPDTVATGANGTYGSPYSQGPSTAGGTSSGAASAGQGATSGGDTAGAGTTVSGDAGTGTSGGGAAAADTSHCVDGRQFDPAIDYFAPPCVARFVGDNAGATYDGVTADTITVVNYYPQGNSAVDATLRAQGLYVSIDEQRAFDEAAEEFINAHYELYGRAVSIETVQGQCSTIPPDTACLRNEMRQIVAARHPFVFRWISPLTSAPFDELSALGVLNIGGLMFTDEFSEARRPYHWDVHQSGTRIARAFGEWWCSDLAGRAAEHSNSSSPAGIAGNPNGRQRVLGIIGTNDPENIAMREEVDRVLQGCGDRVWHTYDASNDLSTAAAQKSASVASMRQSPEATTVLCLCNPVGAAFVYEEMQQQAYYPENVIAGTVFIDADESGQSFMEGSGCPTGSECEFTTAFGLSSSEPREPVGADAAARIWQATGRPGTPPFDGAQIDWDYDQMIASLLQGAGPVLTPESVEQGAFAAGARGGGDSGHVLRGFAPGSYAWNQDMAIVYWDAERPSPFNGEPGSFVTIGPRRRLGEYQAGTAPIPVRG